MNQVDVTLLANILSFLTKKNGHFAGTSSTNPIVQSIASAARGIFATAADAHFIVQAVGEGTLARWAAGDVAPNEIAHPQLIAATLLWADTWKRGS
jgi:hypothetical protein